MKKKRSLFLRLIHRAEEEKQRKHRGIWEKAEENVPVRERFHFSQKEKMVSREIRSFFQKEYFQKEREQEKKGEKQLFLLPSYGKERERKMRQEIFSPLGKKTGEKTSKEKESWDRREFWRQESFGERKDVANSQREFGNLFFADMRQEKQEKTMLEELSRFISEVRETDGRQNVTIHIGQIRETVDVDKVMEEMTKKLWEARSMGRSRAERWR